MSEKYYQLVKQEKSADLTIYGDITSTPAPWSESDVSSYELVKELDALDVDSINVRINSYGGEVAEALAIANALMRNKAMVNTYVDGFACSAATIIFMAGDRRVVSKYSNFLVHNAWTVVEGNADDLRKEANNLDAITEQSVQLYVDRTGKSRDQIVDLMSEEKFLTPEETLAWGFATEIEDPADKDNARQSVEKLVYDKLHAETGMLESYGPDYEELKAVIREVMQECVAQKPAEEPTPEEAEPESEQADDTPAEEPEEKPENMSVLERYRKNFAH